jgi:conjugal transfer ATP-binding protein TraC
VSPASVQARIDLEAIDHDVARFGSGRRAHYLAALDVTGADPPLGSADDATQEAILAGRAQFLNAQVEPFQLVVRTEPARLDEHLDRIRRRAQQLPPALAALARDHAAFVGGLARQRTLLERRCYVVLPSGREPRSDGPSVWRRLMAWVPGLPRGESTAGSEHGRALDAGRRLAARCDEVGRQLGRSGLRTRRVDGRGYGELYRRCWTPELAHTQRFRLDLDAYTAPVVRGAAPALGRAGQQQSPLGPGPDTHAPAAPPASGVDEHLLELGTRSLADLVAPAGCEVRADHLRLDGQYARVLAVTAYPRTVAAGWLEALVDGDLPVELSLHVRPLSSADVIRGLGHQLVQLQASRLLDAREGRLADPEREIAIEDAERLREALQRGHERVFSVGVYLLVRGSTRQELDERTRRVEVLLDGLLAHSRRLLWEQERGYRSWLPEGRDPLLVARNLDTSALAATLPFVGSSLTMEQGMLYGVSARSQTPVILDPFDQLLDNANMVVAAPAGSGKSFFVKLLALRNLCAGTDFVVIDPEDEYRAVAAAAGGQVIRLAASSPHRLNPFDLPPPLPAAAVEASTSFDDEDPLAERITALLGLLELLIGEGRLSADERSVLDRAIHQAYGRTWEDELGARGGIRRGETATYGRPAPLLRDLHAVLDEMPDEVTARLATRLERYVSGSLGGGLFAGPTNIDLDQPLVVFQVRDLAPELKPLAIHVIAGHVWNSVRRTRRPRQLIVDEAATLLGHAEGGAFLANLARRARKHYLGLVTLSQQLEDFTGCEHGETVLQNAAMVLLLKQKAESIGAVDARFRLTAEERQLLLGADKGEGLLLVSGRRLGSLRIPLQVVASPAEYRLATTNPRDLEQLARAAEGAARPSAPSLDELLAARRAGAGVPVERAA